METFSNISKLDFKNVNFPKLQQPKTAINFSHICASFDFDDEKLLLYK
jgi:hypothetical protein